VGGIFEQGVEGGAPQQATVEQRMESPVAPTAG
jgi:hypothetical protein